MRTATITLAAFALLLAAAASPTPAASIHREVDASVVRASSPMATLSTAPFDDTPGLLSDGVHYFWIVNDDDGAPLSISVHENHPLGTVRISFDDGHASSAPVDANLSTVLVEPASIPADGVSVALITVVPRDANGIELGTGLALAIDGSALWRGFVLGAITDEGDGSYTARVVSTAPGEGEVWVEVEAVALEAEPTVGYESVGGPYNLREIAILRLQALLASGGAFDQLRAGLDPDSDPGAYRVLASLAKAQEALQEYLEGAYEGDKSTTDNHIKGAVGELVAALDDPGLVAPQGIRNLIDDLLEIARDVALFHITEATEACGPCTSQLGMLCSAHWFLQRGDDERAASHPDYEQVANFYGAAAGLAYDAADECP